MEDIALTSGDVLPGATELNRVTDSDEVFETRANYSDSGSSDPRGFKGLSVWQMSMELVAACYRLSSIFPTAEMLGLTRQLRRSAVSVALNIAEGWGRNSKAEMARFCDISRGSLHEVDASIEIALKLGFLQQIQTEEAFQLINRVSAMLRKLILHLRKK